MKHQTVARFGAITSAVLLLVAAGAPQKPAGGPGHRPKHPPDQTPHHPTPGTGQQFGSPLPDLTSDQLAAFVAGRDEFENIETVASGLGPIFNNVGCASCHSLQTSGGASDLNETRFGRVVNGKFDPMADLGGSLLQQFAIDPAALEVVPAAATVIAHRQTTPLFGAGLIEAIPDEDIAQNAVRRKPDGVKGSVSMVVDVTTGKMRVGRFGWKAQHATLLGFAGDAYLNEMGITNRFFPTENAPNGNAALLAQFDTLADPEDEVDPATGTSDIDKAADFMRFLGAPPPLRGTRSTDAGARSFETIGCAACHQPTMFTGANAVAALSSKPVPLYSDVLLHDMGSLGDGIAQASAGQREMKTAPLWGLRASAPYLHDGRAATIADAISAHDGEAAPARDRFARLNATERQQLLDFLGSI
jgi:CxxC motif-containing protein (DUF1111 family)